MYYYSPLEQFLVLPLIFSNFTFFTINNILFTYFFLFILLSLYFLSILNNKFLNLHLVTNKYQFFFEIIFNGISSVLQDNIESSQKRKFFPLVGSVFFFLLNLNLYGVVPYTFTITSQLIITFSISLFIFIGIQLIAVRTHKIKFFSIFFPSGVSVLLSLVLVPIELISFFFKPISLSIRLFANMMAGHTLLKVIAGFIWIILVSFGILAPLHYLPLAILIILFALEVGVALIQSFVFSVLLCVYINDIYNLH